MPFGILGRRRPRQTIGSLAAGGADSICGSTAVDGFIKALAMSEEVTAAVDEDLYSAAV